MQAGVRVKKSDVLELVSGVPEEIDLDDLLYRLYLKLELELSEAAVAAGDVLSHEEVVRLSGEWSK